MNRYYRYFYGDEKLNRKKPIIFVIIGIIILVAIFLIVLYNSKKEVDTINNSVVKNKTSNIYYDKEKSISIELSNTLDLNQTNSELGYLIELKSDDNLDIFISKQDLITGKNLSTIVDADKKTYIESFSNTSNISEIKELLVGDKKAYTYSFQYLDTELNEAFYLQIVWLETDNGYYIFDIEFPLNDLNLYTNVITNVLTSFKIL